MAQTFARPWIKTSVNISPELYKLSRQHKIKFSEALRVGISIMLAEMGVTEYDNKLNIVRRCNELKLKAAEFAQRAADLENDNNDPI